MISVNEHTEPFVPPYTCDFVLTPGMPPPARVRFLSSLASNPVAEQAGSFLQDRRLQLRHGGVGMLDPKTSVGGRGGRGCTNAGRPARRSAASP